VLTGFEEIGKSEQEEILMKAILTTGNQCNNGRIALKAING
jgi:hypothetical protein